MKDLYAKVLSVVRTPSFLIPSIIILVGITWFFYHNFDPARSTSLMDSVGYWLIYLVCMLFLQFVIYVNIRKQMERDNQRRK